MRNHLTSACLLGFVLACSSSAFALRLNFELTGDQVVPGPSGSSAYARGAAVLNETETEVSIAIEHDVADPISAAIYLGDFGTNGTLVYALPSLDPQLVANWAPTPAEVDDLLAGRLYIQIESSTYPAGDIRGQIAPKHDPEPGDVLISELMYNPRSDESGSSPAEWIELFNPTFSDIDISGWYFEDEDVIFDEPCTPKRSGSIPSFVLRSGELVVVIPDGGAAAPSVTDFETAWGVAGLVNVIQLMADGTASGAIVGNNLANAPINDGNDANDFPLANSVYLPCNTSGVARPDNEILTLVGSSGIIDVVNYDDEAPWPVDDGAASISLVPADYPGKDDLSSYTATGNDDGANWILHTAGDAAGGRQQVAAAGVYGGEDIASPGYVVGASSVNLPPTAESQTLLSATGGEVDITLIASDTSRPFLGLLLFIIKSLPEHGTLIDVMSNHVITPADVAGDGYLIPRPPFTELRYVGGSECGEDSFTFQAFDGALHSPETEVTIVVQCGEVVITELMYNPDSYEGIPCLPEWVEILNTSSDPIDLAGWYLEDANARGGDLPAYILGPQEAVAIIPSASDLLEFDAAWNAPVIQASTNGETSGGALVGFNLGNTDGDDVHLIRPGGPNKQVVDAVHYRNGGDWPNTTSPNDGVSIYVSSTGMVNVMDNDTPANWLRAVEGVDGAYLMTPDVNGIYNGVDIGSPGEVFGITPGRCASASDQNSDGAVDMADFVHFSLCLLGPVDSPPGNCECFDVNLDGQLDLIDYAAFQRVFDVP